MSKFDVFISFKNSDNTGARTQDYYMANELFSALTKSGISVFFSPVSIKQNAVSNYSKYIDDAIEQSDILIAVGTSVENLSSRWVYYEIDSFRNELNNGNKDVAVAGMISYISPDVNVNKLPMCLRRCEAFTDISDVVEWVRNRKRSRNSIVERFIDRGAQIESEGITVGSTVLDHYKILNVIGKGGMSTVYQAFDELRGRTVAIKIAKKGGRTRDFEIILAGLNAELELLKRFHYPSLPQIYDAIVKPDMMLIIMDYVEGRSLEMTIREHGAQSENEVINWGKKLCETLFYLHSLNPPVIYRDMKPGNVMIRPDGNITLVDFGTAREYKEKNTADTICLGTVGYAAPEQFGGMGQSDFRTDIYGLGVTLYHTVTGMNPSEPPYEIKPIRSINPTLSPGLEFIISKCVKRDPNERYQSAKELLHDLDNVERIGKKQNSLFKRLSLGAAQRKSQRIKKGDAKIKEEASESVVPSVPEALRKIANAPVAPGRSETSYSDFGSFGTTVLSGDDAHVTRDTTKLYDEITKSSAYDLLRKLKGSDVSQDTCELGTPAVLCVTHGVDENEDSSYFIWFYILTNHSKSKVLDIMSKSKFSRDVLTKRLFVIPYEKVLSITICSEQAKTAQSRRDFLWNSELCYGRFRLTALQHNCETIPVQFNVCDDEKVLLSLDFDIKGKNQ